MSAALRVARSLCRNFAWRCFHDPPSADGCPVLGLWPSSSRGEPRFFSSDATTNKDAVLNSLQTSTEAGQIALASASTARAPAAPLRRLRAAEAFPLSFPWCPRSPGVWPPLASPQLRSSLFFHQPSDAKILAHAYEQQRPSELRSPEPSLARSHRRPAAPAHLPHPVNCFGSKAAPPTTTTRTQKTRSRSGGLAASPL